MVCTTNTFFFAMNTSINFTDEPQRSVMGFMTDMESG